MNEPTLPTSTSDQQNRNEVERTKQVTVAGWTAGVSAFFAVSAVTTNPTWPTAVGVSAVAMMVATVCFFILKR